MHTRHSLQDRARAKTMTPFMRTRWARAEVVTGARMHARPLRQTGGPTDKMICTTLDMHMAHAQLQHPPRLESVSGEAETVRRLWYNELTTMVFMGSPATTLASRLVRQACVRLRSH